MKCRSIRFSIDSHLDNAALVGVAVNRICATYCSLDEVAAYQLEVCVVEAVNNAIKHAYQGEAGHEVEVLMKLNADSVEFEVGDEGRTMGKKRALSRPTLDFDPSDYGNLPEGGMGRYIMCEFMDSVCYRTQGGRNVLSLGKKFDQQSATE